MNIGDRKKLSDIFIARVSISKIGEYTIQYTVDSLKDMNKLANLALDRHSSINIEVNVAFLVFVSPLLFVRVFAICSVFVGCVFFDGCVVFVACVVFVVCV